MVDPSESGSAAEAGDVDFTFLGENDRRSFLAGIIYYSASKVKIDEQKQARTEQPTTE